MKKFMMSVFAAVAAVAITGCCSDSACSKAEKSCPKAEKQCPKAKKSCPKAEKQCPKAKKCTMTCAKAKKCPFLGKWEFAISQNGKLSALPVDHVPTLELCKKGVMKFHYVKDGKAAVLEGKWKVAKGKLIVSDVSGKNTQAYTLNKDGSAEFTVGADDRLPADTKVIIRKKK